MAAVTWIQSRIRDPFKREVLHDIDRVRRKLSSLSPECEETDLAYKTYANLVRTWSDS